MNLLRGIMCAVVLGTLALALRADDKKSSDKPDNAKLLVGSWECTKSDEGGSPVGMVANFSKDGKIKVTFKNKDGSAGDSHEGTYKVDGDKFTITMGEGSGEFKMVFTIKKISDTDLAIEDEKGKASQWNHKKGS